MIVLPTNLKEDDYEGSKKWQQSINGDGTYSFQDVTEYKERGAEFGATEVNKIHAGIMGFVSCNTTFNDDGTILEVDAWGNKKKTTFNEDGSIFEALYTAEDVYLGGKTTTFLNDGKEVKEEVIMA